MKINMSKVLLSFKCRIRGANLAEFSIVVGLIAVVAIGSVFFLGSRIDNVFCQVSSSVRSSVFNDDSLVCEETVANPGDEEAPPPDLRYPSRVEVNGVNYVWHVNADSPIAQMQIDPGEIVEVSFAQAVELGQWTVTAEHLDIEAAPLVLEVNVGAGWVPVSTVQIDPLSEQTESATFAVQEATEWRLVWGGASRITVSLARLGTATELMPLLPALDLDPSYTMTVGEAFSLDLADFARDTAGDVRFEFQPTSVNGIAFAQTGVLEGTPLAATDPTGNLVLARVVDDRGITSDWFEFSLIAEPGIGGALASEEYPVNGTNWVAQYSNSGAVTTIAPGQNNTLIFAEPIAVNAWSTRAATGSGMQTISYELQYRNASNTWVTLATQVISDSALEDRQSTFAEVVASEFRIVNLNASYTLEISHTRLGYDGTYPAFLPHVALDQTVSVPFGPSVSGSLTDVVLNTVGAVEYEVVPFSANGLIFGTDGSITGAPTAVIPNPGFEISVRVQDTRGI